MRENPHIKQIRRLIFLLIGSVTLNIGFSSYFVYSYFSASPLLDKVQLNRPLSFKGEDNLGDAQSLNNVLSFLEKSSFEELVEMLKDKRFVEKGYRLCDLSLGMLLKRYYLDIERALEECKKLSQPRKLTYTNGEILVFTDATDTHFKSILEFIKTEKWPVTHQGYFELLSQKRYMDNTSLKKVFFATPEFHAIMVSLKRGGNDLDQEDVLKLLLDGDWKIIVHYLEEQRKGKAFRQDLLKEYLKLGSKQAAYIFLKIDYDYAVNKLDNETVIAILQLLSKDTQEARKFAFEMLKSPRNDSVRQLAAFRLYQFYNIDFPKKYSHKKALRLFAKQDLLEKEKSKQALALHQKENSSAKRQARVSKRRKKEGLQIEYTVQKGDTLWKISRQFNVSLENLRQKNNLKSDRLVPGMKLVI